jgi:hypothetical protein
MLVKDKYRSNPLSKILGGSIVTVHYEKKKSLEYDKIKSPKHYVNKIIKEAKAKGEFEDITSIEDSEGNVWYTKKQ